MCFLLKQKYSGRSLMKSSVIYLNQQTTDTMNKVFKILTGCILLLSVTLSGCQTENEVIIAPNPDEVISPNTNISNLIKNVALKDGSTDNIIDNSSCISIMLPVTVIVNGQEFSIHTEDDLDRVEEIFDEFEEDTDSLTLNFPITVIKSDFTEIIISNEEQLENLADDCKEGGLDDDIECIDFVYPITINIYDSNNQVADVITLGSDKQLHDFFDDLEEGVVISFHFPFTVTLYDNSEIEINNNIELESLIESVEDECDEDDDNDFNDDDVDDTELRSVLMNGSWQISYFYYELDKTSQFSQFSFLFTESDSVSATDGVEVTVGSWKSGGDSGELEVEMQFDEAHVLAALNEGWEVIEFTENMVRMTTEESGEIRELTINK
jgi:hypothetical protein